MKLSDINATLDAAGLPPVTRAQLQPLVGTMVGKAFAADLARFAAGETGCRPQLRAVVDALAPDLPGRVEGLGFAFDLAAFAAAARQDPARVFGAMRGDAGLETTRAVLAGAGLAAMIQPASAAKPPPPYASFKIHGKSAALCVTEARTISGNQHTVQVEGARVLDGPGPRAFDWSNKLIVQFTVEECYVALALLENRIRKLSFDGHGRRHDKSLRMELQDGHYHVQLIQCGRAAVSVQVRPVNALPFVAMLYKQILRNEPHLDVAAVRGMTERMAGMMGG